MEKKLGRGAGGKHTNKEKYQSPLGTTLISHAQFSSAKRESQVDIGLFER